MLQVPEKYTEQYQDIPNKARRKFAGMVTCMDEGITVEIVQPSDVIYSQTSFPHTDVKIHNALIVQCLW